MPKKIAVIGTGYLGQAFIEFAKDHFPIVTYDVKDGDELSKTKN